MRPKNATKKLKTIWQIFFIIGNKDKMQRDMDQVCVIVVVVVATILLCMGYVEMTKMNKFRPQSTSTCGRKAEIQENENENDSTISAKRGMMHPNQTGQKPNDLLKMEDDWMNTDVNCKHEEMTQDDEKLKQSFEWTLPEDHADTKKFKDYAASHDKMHMKHAANVRPYGPRITQVREALGSKNTGVPGYMEVVRQSQDKCTGKSGEIVKFEKECVAFGGSDQYVQARAASDQACTM